MQARRDKNVCYNCDDIFTPGHRCEQRQVIMMMTEEEDAGYKEGVQDEDEQTEEEVLADDITVSVNAMIRSTNLNTLRVKGVSNQQDIQILIDSGSTNCFLDEGTAATLCCKLEYTTPMVVSVADGSKLVSRTICPEFHWDIQGHTFVRNYYQI